MGLGIYGATVETIMHNNRFYRFFDIDFLFSSDFTGRFRRYDEYLVPPVATESDQGAKEMEEKQQRAKVQTKRHKARTFHCAAKKDVPRVLVNFVNRNK